LSKNANVDWVAITKLPAATTNTSTSGSVSSAKPSGTAVSTSSNSASGSGSASGSAQDNGTVSLPFASYWIWSTVGLLVGFSVLYI